MSDGRKGLKNWLEVRGKELSKVISLFKGPLLARSMNKDQGTLISISNCSLCIDRSCTPAVKLVLYASGASPLPLFLVTFSFAVLPWRWKSIAAGLCSTKSAVLYERSGCGWCGTYSCYTVTTCTDTKCTVVRVAPQSIRHRPPTHGTGPVPTLPSTHKHQRLSANPNRPAGRGR